MNLHPQPDHPHNHLHPQPNYTNTTMRNTNLINDNHSQDSKLITRQRKRSSSTAAPRSRSRSPSLSAWLGPTSPPPSSQRSASTYKRVKTVLEKMREVKRLLEELASDRIKERTSKKGNKEPGSRFSNCDKPLSPGGKGTAQDKIKTLREAGATVVESPA